MPAFGVGVQDAGHIVPRAVDRRVDHVARQVHAILRVGVGDDLAVEVDLDQRRGGNLLVHHPERVDEEMLLAAGNTRRDVVEVQVRHAVEVDEAIARGEIDPDLPLRRIDAVGGLRGRRVDLGHGVHRTLSCLRCASQFGCILDSVMIWRQTATSS
jgi:hypothetical protein